MAETEFVTKPFSPKVREGAAKDANKISSVLLYGDEKFLADLWSGFFATLASVLCGLCG
jgi:hypothetical protein